MSYRIHFIILFLFLTIFKISAQKNELDYIEKAGFEKFSIISKNDTISFLLSKQFKKDKPTILFIQGSLPLPIVFYENEEANSILPFKIDGYKDKYNFVIIARKGIPITGSYEKDSKGFKNYNNEIPLEFIKNDNVEYRASQTKLVINHLIKNKLKNKELFVLGHSEGYRVAAMVAAKNKKIKKLVCISADPINRISETILKNRYQCFLTENDSTLLKDNDLLIRDFKNIPPLVNAFKKDYELYNWLCNNRIVSYKSFEKFKNPILVIYGSDDIKSANNDLLPLLLTKNNLTIKAFPNCGHNFEKKELINGTIYTSYHWDSVFDYINNWLSSI